MAWNALHRDGNIDSALKVVRHVIQKVDSTNRTFVWLFSGIIRGDKRLRSFVRLRASDDSNDSVNYYKAVATNKKIFLADRATKDSLRKLGALGEFAHNTAIAGANDEAIAAFRLLLSTEYPESRAALRIDPTLAALRRDPRFQRLIAEASSSR